MITLLITAVLQPHVQHAIKPSPSQIELLRALESRDMSRLRRFIDKPVRLQIVWDSPGDRGEAKFHSRFSKEAISQNLVVNQVTSGSLTRQTKSVDAREMLGMFAGELTLNFDPKSESKKYIFYSGSRRAGTLVQYSLGSIIFYCEVESKVQNRPKLRRIVILGHSPGFEDWWANR